MTSDGAGPPRLVGDDDLDVPVLEVDLELGDQARARSPYSARAAQEAEAPAVPAVAERDRRGPWPSASSVRDVVRAVAQPPLVGAPPGAEDVVADGRCR